MLDALPFVVRPSSCLDVGHAQTLFSPTFWLQHVADCVVL